MKTHMIHAAAAIALATASIGAAADPSDADSNATSHHSKAVAFVDDSAVTTAVKAKFIKDSLVKARDISVETHDGVVELTGSARTEAEKMRAEEIAKDTKGAHSVRNNIVVSAAATSQ